MSKGKVEELKRESIEAARQGNIGKAINKYNEAFGLKKGEPKEIGHELTDEVVCPYCGYEHEASYEMFDGGDGEEAVVQCNGCGKTHPVYMNISVTYTSRKCNLVNCIHCGREQPAEYITTTRNEAKFPVLDCYACRKLSPASGYEGKEISQESEGG